MLSLDEADLQRRFGGLERLYGVAGAARIRAAHVAVVGIGGVGSWATEALARSGVGRLTLIDLDNVAESNINRQIHALSNTLGQAKVEAMRERIALIHPECRVDCVEEFVEPGNWPRLLPARRPPGEETQTRDVREFTVELIVERGHLVPPAGRGNSKDGVRTKRRNHGAMPAGGVERGVVREHAEVAGGPRHLDVLHRPFEHALLRGQDAEVERRRHDQTAAAIFSPASIASSIAPFM